MWLRNIPIPPSSNNSYPTNRFTGRRFKSKDLVLWEKEFYAWALQNRQIIEAARQEFSQPKPYMGIAIDTQFFMDRTNILTKDGRPKRPDTSNLIKHLHDAVAKVIGIDDCYFWMGSFSKSILTNSVREYCHVKLLWQEIVLGPIDSSESQ